jgi:hypothetical protein
VQRTVAFLTIGYYLRENCPSAVLSVFLYKNQGFVWVNIQKNGGERKSE